MTIINVDSIYTLREAGRSGVVSENFWIKDKKCI